MEDQVAPAVVDVIVPPMPPPILPSAVGPQSPQTIRGSYPIGMNQNGARSGLALKYGSTLSISGGNEETIEQGDTAEIPLSIVPRNENFQIQRASSTELTYQDPMTRLYSRPYKISAERSTLITANNMQVAPQAVPHQINSQKEQKQQKQTANVDEIRRQRNREYARQSRERKRREFEALQEYDKSLRDALGNAERHIATLQETLDKTKKELEATRQSLLYAQQEQAKLCERLTRSEHDCNRLLNWIGSNMREDGETVLRNDSFLLTGSYRIDQYNHK